MQVDNATITTEFDKSYLVFDANPRLRYNIFKKEFLDKNILIKEIANIDGQVKIAIDEEIFFVTYTIMPYYVNDNGEQIFGIAYRSNLAIA
ncbi:MAG: hypothetical protein RR348_06055, partial [Clostridia bacterium]